MMILTKQKIIEEVTNKIEIVPFLNVNVNNNSYSVSLGSKLLVYTSDYVDTAMNNPVEEITIPNEGLVLKKGNFYVGHIQEYIGSDYYVPILHGVEEIAKKGLFVHVTANLIDIGNHCNFSLQLYPTEDIRVYPGIKIAQVSFWQVSGNIKLYKGKYNGIKGPASSQSYRHMAGYGSITNDINGFRN